jgi:hypothetical protein
VVRGVAHDSNPDCPRHPHKSDSVHPITRQLATDDEHTSDHGDWRLFAVLAAFGIFGICAAAAALLVAAPGNFGVLRGFDAVGKGLAAAKVVDLASPDMNNRRNKPPGKRPSNIAFLIAIGGLLSLTVGADLIVSQQSRVLGWALICVGVGLVIFAIWWAAK